MTLHLAHWKRSVGSLNVAELGKLGIGISLPATALRPVQEVGFTLTRHDPPIGGTAADAAVIDSEALGEGIYALEWSAALVGGSSSNWKVETIDPEGNRTRIWTLRPATGGAIDRHSVDPIYLPAKDWKIGLRNASGLADADVFDLQLRWWPYTR